MRETGKYQQAGSERTLLTAVLLSAFGPFVTAYAAVTSGSATQAADFIRRSAELAASFVAWLVFYKLRRETEAGAGRVARLERVASLTSAWALVCSGAALLAVAAVRLATGAQAGRSALGLVIAVLGLLVNMVLWRRYARLRRKEANAVLAAQQRLYRAKTCVDVSVSAALAVGVFAPAHPAAGVIDILGCVFVAVYLGFQGAALLRGARSAARREASEGAIAEERDS